MLLLLLLPLLPTYLLLLLPTSVVPRPAAQAAAGAPLPKSGRALAFSPPVLLPALAAACLSCAPRSLLSSDPGWVKVILAYLLVDAAFDKGATLVVRLPACLLVAGHTTRGSLG